LEYTAFLLWVASKEIQRSLPEQYAHEAIDYTFSALCNIFVETHLDTHRDFNPHTFQSLIRGRFETYYGAWRAFPIDDDELSELTLAHNFVLLCVTDGDLAQAKHPEPDKYVRHIQVVLRFYHVFTGRVKAIISRH